MAASASYSAGDAVEVFFRIGLDRRGGYVPVQDESSSLLQPLVGFTDGWVAAIVLCDWPRPEDAAAPVYVCHAHAHWCTKEGDVMTPVQRKEAATAAAAVRAMEPHAAELARDAGCAAFFAPLDVRNVANSGVARPVPCISLLVVRWGSPTTPFDDAEWGGQPGEEVPLSGLSASVSNQYIGAVCDETLHRRLGPNYEVLSVFVRSSDDLARLQYSDLAARLRGRHKCGLYFLWPTRFRDGSPKQQVGMVNAPALFGVMEGMEAVGVPTRFPHPSQLYRTLVAKEWQALLCQAPQFCVPPTTLVNRAHVLTDAPRAAARALNALRELRSVGVENSGGDLSGTVAARSDDIDYGPDPECGVVKLGYAWEATQVRFFSGELQLAREMTFLCAQEGCESVALLVQGFVPNDFEMRVYVVQGQQAHVVYSTFDAEEDSRALTHPSFAVKSRAEAIADWLESDEAAMVDAERAVVVLVTRWMRWLTSVSSDAVPAIRMDFLVQRVAPGRAEVHSLELTEMGFSLFRWKGGPNIVLGALFDSFFDASEPPEATRTPVAGLADSV